MGPLILERAPGTVLPPARPEDFMPVSQQKIYRSGTGKLLHAQRWSKPEIVNAGRELSRSMKGAAVSQMKALKRALAYCVAHPDRGWLLNPKTTWDGKQGTHKFRIGGEADSDFGKCPVTRRSVSGNITRLEGVAIIVKSLLQKITALSVTEGELNSGVTCAQDMLYCMRAIESVGLEVEKPMILKIDNKGAVDLANNWSCAGRTRHVKLNFLRELKEQGIIKTIWFPGWSNPSDIGTKNLAGPAFKKCGETLYGKED